MRKKSQKNSDSKAPISNLRPMLSYLRPYKLYILFAFIALIFTSGSVLAIGKGIGYLVDEGLGNNNPDLLNYALLSLLGITALLAIGTFSRFYFITYTGEMVIADIRRDIYNHILSLSPEFFEKNKSGDILSKITTDTTLLQVVVGSSLSVALRNILMFIGGTALLIHTSAKLTMIVAVVVPLVVVPIVILGRKLRVLSKESQDKVSNLSSHSEETINGIKTIQSFVREALEKLQFSNLVDESLRVAKKRILIRSLLTAIVIMFIFSAVAFVLWVGGNDVLSGKMSAGQLSSFIFYSIIVAGATGAISEVIGELQRAAGASERIMDLLNTKSSVTSNNKAHKITEDIDGSVSFENVSFSYPSTPEKQSISNFTLDIKNGETIALVGASGAGKSTIFQLLLRFYDNKQGKIKIGGIDIKDMILQDLRGVFGLVPQDPVIFSSSAYDNILFGRPEASESEVKEAAQSAMAFNFIKKLPQGFGSFLGEKGVRLSGGEKQRIAIARVFLKNPKILLLDEATSALDVKNEKQVQKAFEKLMEDRTTLIIAHRLSTVQKADKIVVIEQGNICEVGTHSELMKRKGAYSKLVQMQFDS